ncbi:hypothetical protein [Legionella norrlandica]|uniref:hypothetical protein n=1 Tax=Legionella norrlandica TaxID=1498499 RepID=UPI00126A7701|nr:hypothetical protein [Legionella norrlandica]
MNYTITRFNMPQNMDELIAEVRFNLVDRIANIIAEKNPQGIHVHNRVIEVARDAGFGVWPINTDYAYSNTGSSNLSDAQILARLKAGFANHFQLFSLVNLLRDELQALMATHGYDGKRELENDYKQEEYQKFCECLNLFIPIPKGELFEIEDSSGQVININWQNVKHQLLKKLRDEYYVTLSEAEEALLDGLLLDENRAVDVTTLSTLISNGYELVQFLVQFLEFFNAWCMEKKAVFVSAILYGKSSNAQKELLAILHNEAPQLTALLKKEPSLQAIYFAIAIAEKDVVAVRAYVEQGVDINAALPLLFSQAHKSDTLYWLHEHQHLLKTMTVVGMNIAIDEGKYQGQTIAETLTSTKKGRQLLLENSTLQTLLTETTMGNRLAELLNQAETERGNVSTQAGFFKKSSSLANELVQYIVYEDFTKSQALLKANPSSLETLLKEKVTVIDYSRRKAKQKTAFQAALCAMDDELCAMLAKYMPEEEMACQYQEIFREGHEKYYQEQTSFDFSQIVETISQSSDTDIQKAISLEIPNDTLLWRNLERFRVDFTKRSFQEAVFNPQHLINAFELYDSQYDDWSWNQKNLFWRQVIGYVQRFLPANIAMDFAQGLYGRVENKEKPARSVKFKYGKGSIFPLAFDSFSGLGYEYAIGPLSRRPRGPLGAAPARFLTSFSKLMSSKNIGLGRIIQPEVGQHHQRWCLIQ